MRAPDHGRLKPWRFVVLEGEARSTLADAMAELLQRKAPQATQAQLDASAKDVKALAADGIPFIEGMRLLAGAPADLGNAAAGEDEREWAHARAGDELAATLRRLATPETAPPPGPPVSSK